MYRLGSLVRLDILRRTAVAILEDREHLNIESAPDFFNRILEPELGGFGTSLDADGKIGAPDIFRIRCHWYK